MNAHGGVQGSICTFITAALDGQVDIYSQFYAMAVLPPGKKPPIPITQKQAGTINRVDAS